MWYKYIVLLAVVVCVHSHKLDASKGTLKTVELLDPPLLGRTASVNPSNAGQVVESAGIFLGSFSGIAYEGMSESGAHKFVVHTDRGPTGKIKDIVPIDGKMKSGRAFILPDYSPKIVRLHVNFNTDHIEVVSVMNLTKEDGITPITGLPNLQFGKKDFAYTDAYPVDLFGNLLPNDPLGADLESIAIASDGSYWFGDEYRPALYHFDAQGRLLDRFIPHGAPTEGGQYGTPALPSVYATRQENRGFEAIALDGDLLYAFLQSPLDNPNSKDNANGQASRNIRILAFNITSYSVAAEYVYVLGIEQKVDKISDAASLGNGRFLIVERDASTKKKSFKNVIEVDIRGATDISRTEVIDSIPVGLTLEQIDVSAINIVPVSKRLIVNVASLGWNADNIEAICVVDPSTIVVVNDNDYQLLADAELVGDGYTFFDRTQLSTFGKITDLVFGSHSDMMFSISSSASTTTSLDRRNKSKKKKAGGKYKKDKKKKDEKHKAKGLK
jgi:3-phytase